MAGKNKSLTLETKIQRVTKFLSLLQDAVVGRNPFSFSQRVTDCGLTWNTRAVGIRKLMVDSGLIKSNDSVENKWVMDFTENALDMGNVEMATKLVDLIDNATKIKFPGAELDQEVLENIEHATNEPAAISRETTEQLEQRYRAKIDQVNGTSKKLGEQLNKGYAALVIPDVKYTAINDKNLQAIAEELNSGKTTISIPDLIDDGGLHESTRREVNNHYEDGKFGDSLAQYQQEKSTQPRLEKHIYKPGQDIRSEAELPASYLYYNGKVVSINEIGIFVAAMALETLAEMPSTCKSVRATSQHLSNEFKQLIN